MFVMILPCGLTRPLSTSALDSVSVFSPRFASLPLCANIALWKGTISIFSSSPDSPNCLLILRNVKPYRGSIQQSKNDSKFFHEWLHTSYINSLILDGLLTSSSGIFVVQYHI
jgi:hypothetical protein